MVTLKINRIIRIMATLVKNIQLFLVGNRSCIDHISFHNFTPIIRLISIV